MHLIGLDDFRSRYRSVRRRFVHIELRDSYGIEAEDEPFQRWKAGDPDAHRLDGWCDVVRGMASRGVRMRRIKIVYEPLSDYQRFIRDASHVIPGAGEDIRWVNRREAATVMMPPTDFWVLDDNAVMFTFHSGSGGGHEYGLSEDPTVVRRCASAFDAAWDVATPHGEYRPGS
ncbi:hypothetical protein GCM10010123_07230 [Pilimelia anulata]|uniref:DUF6879 domain-containing protein n=1 Tax=Pilimelia anulata TaxID=53371 RepID=A0A8J3B7S1_9ACTN|nr:DUF6879 family protein [Pilimelia anulata]GGJ79922.1 hypothetical protein GCM10010123_07230 [Pilimelia anulata]